MQPDRWDTNQSRPRASFLAVGLIGLTCGIIGVLAGGALVWLLARVAPAAMLAPPTPAPLPPPAPRPAGVGDIVRDAPARVAKEIGPTVVTVVSELPSQDSFFGSYRPPPARGSGVIIDPRG
jgi:2-alkenal reductase